MESHFNWLLFHLSNGKYTNILYLNPESENLKIVAFFATNFNSSKIWSKIHSEKKTMLKMEMGVYSQGIVSSPVLRLYTLLNRSVHYGLKRKCLLIKICTTLGIFIFASQIISIYSTP